MIREPAVAGHFYPGEPAALAAAVSAYVGERTDGARGAIMSSGSWRIPGREVPIDSTLAEELRDVALLTEDERAHAREHALEVQLPFVVHRNPHARIVPICLSMLPYESCVRIGTAIADVVIRHGGDVLIVASTDMSHYIPAERAAELDRRAI